MREIIEQLIVHLSQDDDAWTKWWSEQLAAYVAISDQAHEEQYRQLRVMESAYAGMGSFNDIYLSDESERWKSKLYDAIQSQLRVAWKGIGNEYHEEEFDVIPVGAKVYMVKGANECYERNGSPSIIEYTKRHVYTVIDNKDVDITNMPLYTIQFNNSFRFIRHEALEYAE